jgi:hypothetical protein
MTTAAPDTTVPRRRPSVPRRLRRLVVVLLGPLWVRTFRDPVRDGHLRLDGLSASEKLLARCALVMLAVLLGSVLFSDAWRATTLYQLLGDNALRFLPVAALPVGLLGLFLAWSMICWGALDAAPSIRIVVALAFLATESTLGVGGTQLGNGSWVLEHGTTVIELGYFAAPAALALSALAHPLVRGRPRLSRLLVGVLRVALLLCLLAIFGTILWSHVESQRAGFPVLMPAFVDGALDSLNGLLVPLVYVAAITVVDFALDVSTSLVEPARVLSRRWLIVALAGLLAVKLAWTVVLRWDTWRALLTYQPVAVFRTVLSVALLAGLVAVVTRFRPSDDYTLAKERTMYGSSFLLGAPGTLSVISVGLGLFVFFQFGSDVGTRFNEAIPYTWIADWGIPIAAALAIAGGGWLMRRTAGGYGDELGSAAIVVGAWLGGQTLMARLSLGFSYPTVDLSVTLGVLVLLVARGRRLSPSALLSMLTLVVFSWLVLSRGDYISFVGGIVGLPAVLVVVFGVVLTLASGSSFASSTSRRLPREARPLLFVGYLLLSAVILFWVTVTHEPGSDLDSLAGFFFLGLPMAAWLAGRRIVPRAGSDG